MLEQECIAVPTSEDARAIAMLSNLAPGDFAAVKKTSGYSGSGCHTCRDDSGTENRSGGETGRG